MADRLQELLQQRALIKEHLAWLEGEISAATARPDQVHSGAREPAFTSVPNLATGSPTPTIHAAAVLAKSTRAATHANSADAETEAMIAQLAAEEKTPPIPTKKGCWIFFCVTLVVVGLTAWAALHFFYRD